MIQSEEKVLTREEQKERIRQRYKGVDSSELEIVPAAPHVSIYDQTRMQNVGVYARVSTDDPNQTSSYELQKNHYADVVDKHPGWVLYDMYADEGISGTSLKHRDNFMRMIEDCKQHKIDLIVTKSVSRFARNVVDCVSYVRELKALNPPIGVLFETEGIYTLDNNSEVMLSIISTMAQEESHNKSDIMNASIEMRFRRGIFLTPPLLGYDKDENGNLIINDEEAATVRLIFFLYLYGHSCAEIAAELTELGCMTKKKRKAWSASTVLQILTNERHCGDVLARKTYTPNYLDHKSKKNRMNRNQYRKRDHHEAIISRDDFIAVQRMLQNAKYKNRAFLPELHVIHEGALKGFVSVNPRWAGFTLDDYRAASASVYDESGCPSIPSEISVTAKDGQFNLCNYEVARGQFFTSPNHCQISLSNDRFHFNSATYRKLFGVQNIELLLHPERKLLAIRQASKDNRNAIAWGRLTVQGLQSKELSGAAFLPRIFQLMGWNTAYRYQVRGIRYHKENTCLFFELGEAEAFIPFTNEAPESSRQSKLHAYPANWATSFGENFYVQNQPCAVRFSNASDWNIQCPGVIYQDANRPQVTPRHQIAENIKKIVTDIKENANA